MNEDAAQELMPVVAGAVFTLTAHLSQSVRTEQKEPFAIPMPGRSQFVLMLDGSFATSPASEDLAVGFASIGDSSLHIILKKILDFILKTGEYINHLYLLERNSINNMELSVFSFCFIKLKMILKLGLHSLFNG